MQRSNFPSILLYGFGLALALSLFFNGFLLYKQGHHRHASYYELGLTNSARPLEQDACQQKLSAYLRVIQQKDSLIRQLEQAPPNKTIAVRHTPQSSHQ